MAPSADTVLLVVSTKFSRRRATRLAHASFIGVGAKPAGVLLNHVGDAGLIDLYYYRGRGYLKPAAPAPARAPSRTEDAT